MKRKNQAEARVENELIDSELPPHCRVMVLAEAMNQYLRPLETYLEEEASADDLNSIGGQLWNYAQAYSHGVFDVEEEQRIVDNMVEYMNLGENQPLLLFYRMLSRFEALFPEQIQAHAPQGHMVMLDVPPDFPYPCEMGLEDLPEKESPPYTRDRAFFDLLDHYQEVVADPDCPNVEDEVLEKLNLLFFEVFDRWLALKAITEDREILSGCAADYFDFVLEQMMLEAIDFEEESAPLVHAFLVQWLPTQEGVGPNALSFYLTAIEFVYEFFLEKSFMETNIDVLDVTSLLRDTSLALRNEFMRGIKHQLH